MYTLIRDVLEGVDFKARLVDKESCRYYDFVSYFTVALTPHFTALERFVHDY